MPIDTVGWDIGGAHLKACALADGQIVSVIQSPCPLWLGMEQLHTALQTILAELNPDPDCIHAVTMTGELADLFSNREEGVFGLLEALSQHIKPDKTMVFAGPKGFLPARSVLPGDIPAIASANWLAMGYHVASSLSQGLLIDIGSTTSDFLLLKDGKAQPRGYADSERLRYGELVYSGVVRTSLMALSATAPFAGEWVGIMAEHFATTADVYRLTGELPAYADQSLTADGGEKTVQASARRIARLLGRDLESADMDAWKRLAGYFRERQLSSLTDACIRQLSLRLLDADAPFIGAGIGRFLVRELAQRLGHKFLDLNELYSMQPFSSEFNLADCAPAVAVACLARQTYG